MLVRSSFPTVRVEVKLRDFVARDRNGQLIRLGQFVAINNKPPKEPKDVLLSFYAAYCEPCQKEIYDLPLFCTWQSQNLGFSGWIYLRRIGYCQQVLCLLYFGSNTGKTEV
jgi:hypothetical protein